MAISPDGTRLTPATATLSASSGTWSFGTLSVDGLSAAVLLNGVSAMPGWYARVLAVANGGQIYILGSSGVNWYVWQGGQFVKTTSPFPAPAPPPVPSPPPSPPPPSGISPNGTRLAPGPGSLATALGTWTFGPLLADNINAPILLNGASAEAGWAGHLMIVDSGGQLYLLGVSGTHWWLWQGGQFVTSADPPSAPPPYPTAIKLTPVQLQIPDNSPAGTIIATAAVTMSNSSTFTGTLTSSDTTGFFAISGLNIVTARALTAADAGTHTTTVTAHQGGQALSAELSM